MSNELGPIEREMIAAGAEWVTEPLIDHNGELNPSCISQIEAALANQKPPHERLRWDPEWSDARWTFRDHITGAFAKNAIQQSPYDCPDGLEEVVKFLDAKLQEAVDWDEDGLAELSLCDINRILYKSLYGNKLFESWNQPKKGRHQMVFVSHCDQPEPHYDFIDLDALLRNVCIDIRDERRMNDAFDKRFEAEHGSGE